MLYSFGLLLQVGNALNCAAAFPVAIMHPSQHVYTSGIFESADFYYVSGKLISQSDPFLAKISLDGSQIDALVTYQDMFRVDDC